MTTVCGLCDECWMWVVPKEVDDPRAQFLYTTPPACGRCRSRPGPHVFDPVVRMLQAAMAAKPEPRRHA